MAAIVWEELRHSTCPPLWPGANWHHHRWGATTPLPGTCVTCPRSGVGRRAGNRSAHTPHAPFACNGCPLQQHCFSSKGQGVYIAFAPLPISHSWKLPTAIMWACCNIYTKKGKQTGRQKERMEEKKWNNKAKKNRQKEERKTETRKNERKKGQKEKKEIK